MSALLASVLISLSSLLMGSQQADIVFAGDAMQHQGQLDAAKRAGGVYDYSECFTAITPYVMAADYAVVNLETPLGDRGFSGYPCFNAPVQYAEALRDAGFDLMLTANNHTLDRHDKGLKRTVALLDSIGVAHLGTYTDESERRERLPLIKDIRGFKVAFLNYTYGTNGIEIQGDVVVDYIDRQKMKADIEAARNAGAEIVCVAVHWGNEYQLLPHSSQKSLADFLTDQGVDLIIGGHPHVIQPMEVRHSDKYDKDILLVYSLGNFISNMKTRDTRGGAMVRARLTRRPDGRAVFDSAAYSLVFTIPGSERGANYRLVPVEDCTDATWSGACRAFTNAAEDIFKRHNRNVGREKCE